MSDCTSTLLQPENESFASFCNLFRIHVWPESAHETLCILFRTILIRSGKCTIGGNLGSGISQGINRMIIAAAANVDVRLTGWRAIVRTPLPPPSATVTVASARSNPEPPRALMLIMTTGSRKRERVKRL